MVRRTRKIKRSKNKKGGKSAEGKSTFWAKATEGAGDIKTGFFTALAKGKEVGAGAQQGMKDFNEARKAQYQSKITATGGDGEKISLFEKKPQALLKPRRPVFPTQDPPTIIGGKRKTRRKKRRKNKKRKTKKRRKKRKTKKSRRR